MPGTCCPAPPPPQKGVALVDVGPASQTQSLTSDHASRHCLVPLEWGRGGG